MTGWVVGLKKKTHDLSNITKLSIIVMHALLIEISELEDAYVQGRWGRDSNPYKFAISK